MHMQECKHSCVLLYGLGTLCRVMVRTQDRVSDNRLKMIREHAIMGKFPA